MRYVVRIRFLLSSAFFDIDQALETNQRRRRYLVRYYSSSNLAGEFFLEFFTEWLNNDNEGVYPFFFIFFFWRVSIIQNMDVIASFESRWVSGYYAFCRTRRSRFSLLLLSRRHIYFFFFGFLLLFLVFLFFLFSLSLCVYVLRVGVCTI